MTRTVIGTYDGEVMHFATPPDLEPNKEYRLTVLPVEPESSGETIWDVLAHFEGTVDMPEDWSEEHDHYLYGTPKRSGARE